MRFFKPLLIIFGLVALTTTAFEAIIRYYVMFLWRSYTGFEEARDTQRWGQPANRKSIRN